MLVASVFSRLQAYPGAGKGAPCKDAAFSICGASAFAISSSAAAPLRALSAADCRAPTPGNAVVACELCGGGGGVRLGDGGEIAEAAKR